MLDLINVIKPYTKSISALILFLIAIVTFYYANKNRKEDRDRQIKDMLHQAIYIMGEHDDTISINTDIASNSGDTKHSSNFKNKQMIESLSQLTKEFLICEKEISFTGIRFIDKLNNSCLLSPLDDTKTKAYEIFLKILYKEF